MSPAEEAANERQIGGDHYRSEYQHWDFVENNGLGYLEGCATKYATRWRNKHGRQDLEKAKHYVDKLMELHMSARHRVRRGQASPEELNLFCDANHLSQVERMVVVSLSNWNSLDDLRGANLAIDHLLEECTKIEEKRSDNTGQARPFGYDGDE